MYLVIDKVLKENLQTRFVQTAHIMWGKEEKELTPNEVYQTVASVVRQYVSDTWIKTNKYYMDHQEKQVYYFSIEFLLGRLLNSNLISLNIKEVFAEVLKDLDVDLNAVFE